MRAAAVVPGAPVLAAALAPGAADDLRSCVRTVLAALPDGPLVLVGPGPSTREHPPSAWGTLAGLGVAVEAPAAHGDGPPALPRALTVGRHVVEAVGRRPVAVVEVAADAPADACRALGAGLARRVPEGVWVVVGDASARRSAKAPGALDARAEPFDAAVSRALADGDAAALLGLDAGLAADLLAEGRAPWQVLAGAADAAGAPSRARVHLDDAPFGVGYLVATWTWDA